MMEAYGTVLVSGGVVAASVILAIFVKKYLDKQKEAKKRASYPPNTVILHQFGRGPYAPSLSPFPMKLETYLRMTKIPYQNEMSFQMSSKGKTPWMTFNGEDVADSQICIDFLNKKFDIDLNKNLTEEQRATGRAYMILAEDHLYWTILLQRWVFNEDNWAFLNKVVKIPTGICSWVGKNLQKQAHGQGIGRHKKEHVLSLCGQDIQGLNAVIGKKKFLMGDEPCEYDCAVFGMLAQVRWHMPNTIHEKTMKEECKNLMDYCDRIKERYWPDWDDCNTAGGTKEAKA